jgi:hypothetical protein
VTVKLFLVSLKCAYNYFKMRKNELTLKCYFENQGRGKNQLYNKISYLICSSSQYFGGKLFEGLSEIFTGLGEGAGVELWSIL